MDDINSTLGKDNQSDNNAIPYLGWLDGRATRQEWWTKTGLAFAGCILATWVIGWTIKPEFPQNRYRYDYGYDRQFQSTLDNSVGLIRFLTGTVVVIVAILNIPVCVRRVHDLRDADRETLAIYGCAPLLWPLGLLLLAFTDGVPGPNKYGRDPKGRMEIQTPTDTSEPANATTPVVNKQKIDDIMKNW